MTTHEASTLLAKTQPLVIILGLRLERLQKELSKRDASHSTLTSQEEKNLLELIKQIEECADNKNRLTLKPGPEDLGWGPI